MNQKVNILHFGPVPEIEAKTVTIGDATFEVSTKIPYEQVIEMMQWCINSVLDGRTFISEPLFRIIRDLGLLRYYTNLDTETIIQEDLDLTVFYEWYDIVNAHGVIKLLNETIDPEQLEFFNSTLEKTCHSIVAYNNSAAGIVERLTSQNNKDNLEMKTIIEQLGDKEMEQISKLMNLVGSDPLPLATQLGEE